MKEKEILAELEKLNEGLSEHNETLKGIASSLDKIAIILSADIDEKHLRELLVERMGLRY